MLPTIQVDTAKLKELERLVNGAEKKFKKEMAIAINDTRKKVNSLAAKVITDELFTAQKNVRDVFAFQKATDTQLAATITIKKTKRLGLRHFGAKQNKKGVSYKISKTKGRRFIASAFRGPMPDRIKESWKGNVFKREGKARLPIFHKRGPTPRGVYLKSDKDPMIRKQGLDELNKQIDRRIRFLKLKAEGKI